MRPSLSVIIPVLNEAATIGKLLNSLSAVNEIEIIVVDGGSTDSTCSIAAQHSRVVLISSAPGRGVQLNQGAAIAKGDILWFLHADSMPPDDWISAIQSTVNSSAVIAGCFRLGFDHDNWLLRFFGFCSRCNHPLVTFGDQGYFMKRSVFERIGGFRAFPILEDLEIQSRLRKLGSWKKLNRPLVTSARRFTAQGILRQQLKNMVIVAMFLAGASPFWLSRFYRPQYQLKPSAQSVSLNPADLKESDSRKGRFTRFPFSLSSWKASLGGMVGSLSFKPKAR